WPTSKIKQHHRSPPVPLPPLNLTRRKRKSEESQGETVPSSDIRDGQQRHQGTQGTRRIVSSGHQKFVAANYKVDAEKVAPFIKKYLKGAVASGSLVQTKGKGASGSFKLASSTSGGAKVASASDKRKPASSAASKTKKSSAKRTAVATTSDKASSKTAKNKPPQSEEDCCRKEERRRCLRRRSESQEIGRLLG
ncbi:unnamed protein product, partial [Tenebrio molitor]